MLNLWLNRWIDRLADGIARAQERAVLRARRGLLESGGLRLIGNSNLGYRRIGDLLTFYCATSLQTGAKNDADSAPSYLVYEEENATQIVTTTSMALLDATDTDGLYSEQITLAESTGYEFQKDYLIYITATISSIASHAMYSFRIGPEGALLSGNAQAGAAGTVTLPASATATDDLYNGTLVAIIGGTGAGQARTITDYVGSTRVATIEPNWITNPSSASIIAVYHYGRVAIHTGGIVAASFGAGAIDAAAIANGAIDAATFAAGAIDAAAIANAAIDAATFAAGAIDAAAIATGAITSAKFAAGAIDAAAIANGAIDAATFAAGAIDAAAIAADAIGSSELAASAVTEIQAGLATAAALATVQSDTDDIQARLPTTLSGGRMRSQVEGIDANAITATSIAADAIGASELAADAVTEIQSGLATAAALATVQADTDDIQARLPATLVGGRMRSHVEAMDAGVITAAVIATDAIDADALATSAATEIRALASGTADSGTTTSMTDAARTEADDDYWAGSWIVFTSGNIAGQARLITGFVASLDTIDFTPATTQPVTTQTYEIWPAARLDGIEGNIDGNVLGAVFIDGSQSSQIASWIWSEDLTTGYAAGQAGFLLNETRLNVIDIQGRLPASLSGGGFMRSDVQDMAAIVMEQIISALLGTADSGTTTTLVDNFLTQADTDYWAGMILYMRSGSCAGQARRISAFNPATDTLTVDPAFTQAIDPGDDYMILRTAIGTAAAAASTDWTAGERDQIRQALGVTGSVAPTTGTGTLEVAIAGVQSDTDDIQTRLPASLVGGRMRSHVEAMDAGTITAAVIANAAIDAATFATDAIDANALATSAVTEIQSGLATSAAVAAIQADTDDIQTRLPATLNGGRMRSHVEAMDAGVITAAVIATDAIDSDAIATSAVTEIQAGLATAAAVAAIQADTDDIQARLPATLSGGRMRSQVEGMDANTLTAAALASDAADEIIAAVSGTADSGTTTTLVDAARTEADTDYWAGSLLLIRSGSTSGQIRRITAFDPGTDTLTVTPAFTQAISTNDYLILRTAIGTAAAASTDWTAGERDQIRQALGVTGAVALTTGAGTLELAIAGVQSDTNDIQTRLPASLIGGRMRSHVEAMDAGVITAAVIATDAIDSDAIAPSAVTEIQAGLATAAAVAAIQADTDDIQTRLPATLIGGRMRSHVEAMDAGVITAAVIATDAIDADALAADAVAEIVAAIPPGSADWTLAERSQIRQALGVAGALAGTTGVGTLELAAAGIQADTNDIQGRLPLTLNAGRMRSHVEACDPPCSPIAGGGGGSADTFEGVPL